MSSVDASACISSGVALVLSGGGVPAGSEVPTSSAEATAVADESPASVRGVASVSVFSAFFVTSPSGADCSASLVPTASWSSLLAVTPFPIGDTSSVFAGAALSSASLAASDVASTPESGTDSGASPPPVNYATRIIKVCRSSLFDRLQYVWPWIKHF